MPLSKFIQRLVFEGSRREMFDAQKMMDAISPEFEGMEEKAQLFILRNCLKLSFAGQFETLAKACAESEGLNFSLLQ